MAKSTIISLGEYFNNFIASQIDSGRYGSASEVICAGLKMLEDAENKLNTLRRMLAEGEQSGHANYSYQAFIVELDEQDNKSFSPATKEKPGCSGKPHGERSAN